jgi:hypothetical protein
MLFDAVHRGSRDRLDEELRQAPVFVPTLFSKVMALNLLAALDDTADARHDSLPLAVLLAFPQTQRIAEAVPAAPSTPPHIRRRKGQYTVTISPEFDCRDRAIGPPSPTPLLGRDGASCLDASFP